MKASERLRRAREYLAQRGEQFWTRGVRCRDDEGKELTDRGMIRRYGRALDVIGWVDLAGLSDVTDKVWDHQGQHAKAALEVVEAEAKRSAAGVDAEIVDRYIEDGAPYPYSRFVNDELGYVAVLHLLRDAAEAALLGEKQAPLELSAAQRVLRKKYSDGEFEHISTRADLEECGDGLFRFLMVELAETEDCDGLEEAMTRVRSARSQLDTLELDLLEELQNSADQTPS